MSTIPAEYKNYRIIKHNKLINAKEKLNTLQHRIIVLMSSKIKKGDTHFNTVYFKIRHILGRGDRDNIGSGYERVRQAAKELVHASLEVENQNGKWAAYSLITVASGNKKEDFITVKFSDEMKPFFLQLESNYTQYTLSNVYHFQSAYSFRVYELLRQYYPKVSKIAIEYQYLRDLIGLDERSYARFSNFKKRVLEVAQKEINQFSDMMIDFELERSGKSVVQITFSMRPNRKVSPSIELPEQDHGVKDVSYEIIRETQSNTCPLWLSEGVYQGMLSKFGSDLLQFAIQQTEERKHIQKPANYLHKGLKEGWLTEEFNQFNQQQERVLFSLEESFATHNNNRRQEIFQQYDSKDLRDEYILELEYNKTYSSHRRLYLHQWESGEISDSALGCYKGWLLKKFGELKDWDKKVFTQEQFKKV
ncbi:replication initiation protein [Persicobacter sp. CCB-QB2]|uniref:replication initiation protein n=1 Tax=Persicobacter sp. CCB-QB2 TaxID=1561025 RepID=UPI0012F895F1|nr:replication initiation protein [Persicobacter sp. CCB-QB2]